MHKANHFVAAARDWQIWSLFTGANQSTLAYQHRLTVKRISLILAKQRAQAYRQHLADEDCLTVNRIRQIIT